MFLWEWCCIENHHLYVWISNTLIISYTGYRVILQLHVTSVKLLWNYSLWTLSSQLWHLAVSWQFCTQSLCCQNINKKLLVQLWTGPCTSTTVLYHFCTWTHAILESFFLLQSWLQLETCMMFVCYRWKPYLLHHRWVLFRKMN